MRSQRNDPCSGIAVLLSQPFQNCWSTLQQMIWFWPDSSKQCFGMFLNDKIFDWQKHLRAL